MIAKAVRHFVFTLALFLSTSVMLNTQETANTFLLTVFLRHDQTKNVNEVNEIVGEYDVAVFQEQERRTQDRKRTRLYAQAKELGLQLVPRSSSLGEPDSASPVSVTLKRRRIPGKKK